MKQEQLPEHDGVLASQIVGVFEECSGVLRGLLDEHQPLMEEHLARVARLHELDRAIDFTGKKTLRILRAKTLDEAKAILAETDDDAPKPPPPPAPKKPPAKKPSPARKPGPVDLRTMNYAGWGQFVTLLRSIKPDGLDVEEAGPDALAFFREQYKQGALAGAALDAWHARPHLASVEALAHPQTPMEHPSDLAEETAPPPPPAPGAIDQWDDPNANGQGVYVENVRTVCVAQGGPGRTKILIRVAQGADGRFRTGHLVEFPGAAQWAADMDAPPRVDAAACEDEAYAIRTRANMIVAAIKALPGGAGGAWSAEQRRVFHAAIKQVENFNATSRSVQVGRRKAV